MVVVFLRVVGHVRFLSVTNADFSSKCFQDLQILDRSEMAWLDVTATQFEPRRNSYGEHHPSASHVNPHDVNMNLLHDDYSLRWRFGGNNADAFDRLHPMSNNDIVAHHEGGIQGAQHRFHFGSDLNDEMASGQPIGGSPQGNLAGGMQDGGLTGADTPVVEPGFGSAAPLGWRARDYALQQGQTAVRANMMPMSSGGANPNDEETVPTVLVHGRGPGRRAGHTATAVNRRIYVFGGSCGSDYLNDFFILDSDPPPHAGVSEPTSLQLLERRLRHFFNDEDFSDVTFVVQGQKVYGHKMVLSLVSDCFRAMFTTGFRESKEMEIEIPDCSYEAFLAVMEYIYTGQTPKMDTGSNPNLAAAGPDNARDVNLSRIVEILELADRFFLDHLKQICETMLQPAVNAETVEFLLPVAQKTNSGQLQAICEHLMRNLNQLNNNGQP